ncbi:BMP family lipoprotein [Halorubrum tebenquichense]|uniref:Basic membrane lipoprotein n=1 Tax=Halorubrum tebenquichense DSM 14210 TaxID=1227485 RepID=M0DYB2_9EURY|nr:BMP family ABC transporter substrate-binding protein [Halorubrum tebenquichense]ELZ39712.1 basic membrane lipoprotein [Halorubrum tebenquichense DSM 14210]
MASDFDRRRFVKAASAAGLIGLAGCSGGPSDGGDGSDGEDGGDGSDGEDGSDGGDGSDSPPARVGIVYSDGGLGDNSFNDAAKQGIVDAEEEFGIEYAESEPDGTGEFGQYQQRYASSTDPDYDLVSCIGFNQGDALTETASQFPDQDFMIVDTTVDASNVANYLFREEEGSFLMGVLAARLTETDFSAGAGSTAPDSTNVGFIGGVDSPVIRRFQAGFEAGVNYASDDVDVSTSYVGSYSDPTAGQEQALSMYQSGADIVYHAAGATGVGVFQAAQSEGRFAFGVDQDQSVTEDSFADVILASMVKRVDTAVYESISNVVDGDHQGGSTTALGLESNGVECVYGQEIGDQVPDEIATAVSDARDEIIAGNIDVPDTTSN